MKPLELVFQGVTRRHHVDVLADLCATPDLNHLYLSVAFASSSGVALVQSLLAPHKAITRAWVGVRNDVTSWQGLCALLPLVEQLFIVDTAIRHRIFHPKVYLAIGATEARLAVGSANLTTGGLSQNIEASVVLRLSSENRDHVEVIGDIDALLRNLASSFPQHIKLIRRQSELDELLAAGVIIDETVNSAPRPPTTRAVSRRIDDPTPAMKLCGGPLPPRRSAAAAAVRGRRTPARPRPRVLLPKGRRQPAGGLELVWKSKPLTRRDLTIPTGETTNPTGSMLFKKGDWEGIDQRHYFYDRVFQSLTWTPDVARPHLLRAEADFKLVIKNINYGVHCLHLTHNSDTVSPTYKQNNSMTQVSWGAVKAYVARSDLLGRRLYLYRDTADPRQFMIEID